MYNDQSFNNKLTNDMVSFEQLGPGKCYIIWSYAIGTYCSLLASLYNLPEQSVQMNNRWYIL